MRLRDCFNMYKVGNVVKIRHPYYRQRAWYVDRILPSLEEGTMLYRVILIRSNGALSSINIAVTEEYITTNLGGYEEWLQQNKN